MSELYDLIKNSQNKDLNSVEKICNKFAPLIKKYAYKLNYEDSYNDLQLYLIECIYKIPLDKGNFHLSDAYILSYFKKTIYFSYVTLSKKQRKYIYNNLYNYDEDYKIGKITYKEDLSSLEDDLYITDIKNILNNKEYELFYLKFINQLSDSEIAKIKNVSRQAINKSIIKIKNKLKEYYNI